MNKRSEIRTVILVIVLMVTAALGTASSALAQKNGMDEDKTLSPYFFVQSDDPGTDRLPLKSTNADVTISGVMADVTITQVYKNEGKHNLEAIYVFPMSTRAAVYAMRMTVGKRVIDAEIKERKQARQIYEQAKKEGKTASLLEQRRPNVFQMNVANILPGDEIKVELKYTELIEPEETVYEFVYPAVVGPRYSETPSAGVPDSEKWVENPYLHQGEGAPYEFGLNVNVRTGIPIAKLSSPSHGKAEVEYSGRNQAHLRIGNDPMAGTKDFVLRYQLAGGKIETGLMLYPGKDENFFLMMMEPPARVETKEVLPREYIYIVDVSGSMNGFPLTQVAKPMMREMIGALRPVDYMNVLLFAGGSEVMAEGRSLKATKTNKNKAIQWIDSHRGGGGTQILPALKRALALPRTDGVSRIVVVVTDGYVSVEPEVFELIRNNLGQANLFTFGIGSSVNRHLIEGMARVGMGEPFVALNPSQGKKLAQRFKKYVESPVLTDISVNFDGFDAYDVEPVSVPDLFALRPVVVFGKYKGNPNGKITVTGHTVGGPFKKTVPVSEQNASEKNKSLRLLWARHRISRIADIHKIRPDSERQKEITNLGLQYSLMTQFTSFVAVDKIKRADGKLETVKQPLPMPEGVSDLAVADGVLAGGRARGLKTKSAPAGALSQNYAVRKPAPSPKLAETSKDQSVGNSEEDAPAVTGGEDKKEETPGRVSIKVVDVKGPGNAAQLAKVIRSKQALLLDCYNKAISRRHLKAKGWLVFQLTIDAKGRVVSIKPVMNNMNDAPTELCMKTALQALTFPAASGTVQIDVRIDCEVK